MDRIVEGQGVIALAPAVADTWPFLDDKVVDTELIEPGRDRQSRLRTANHQDGRFAVGIVMCLTPYVFPVVAAKIP